MDDEMAVVGYFENRMRSGVSQLNEEKIDEPVR